MFPFGKSFCSVLRGSQMQISQHPVTGALVGQTENGITFSVELVQPKVYAIYVGLADDFQGAHPLDDKDKMVTVAKLVGQVLCPTSANHDQNKPKLWEKLDLPLDDDFGRYPWQEVDIPFPSTRLRNLFDTMWFGDGRSVHYLGDLVKMTEKQVLSKKNLGQGTLFQCKKILKVLDLNFGMTPAELLGWVPPNQRK